MTAGLILVLTLGRTDPHWLGHAWGVVFQGVFLFASDLLHARRVPASPGRAQ